MVKSNEQPRAPRPVNFIEEPEDHRCAFLASLGMATSYICQETGLSKGQVAYRIAKADMLKGSGRSRSEYRNGTSKFCRLVLEAAAPVVEKELMKHLRKI